MRPRIGWKGAIKRSGTAEIAEEERIGGGESRSMDPYGCWFTAGQSRRSVFTGAIHQPTGENNLSFPRPRSSSYERHNPRERHGISSIGI